MPEQPEREIEKTLRAYAKQRQADAGKTPELHPATRRLLQDEAARAHGANRRGAGFWSRWLRMSLPQLAVGLGAIAAIGVTTAILFSKSKPANFREYQMAQTRSSDVPRDSSINKELPAPVMAPPPSPAPVIAQEPAGKFKFGDSKKDLTGASNRAAIDSLTLDAAKTPAAHAKTARVVQTTNFINSGTLLADKDQLQKKSESIEIATAAVPAAPPPPATVAIVTNSISQGSATFAATDRAAASGTVAGESFARPMSPAGHAGSPTKVLTKKTVLSRFQVEMNGDTIRLVDSDGSVYAGKLLRSIQEDGLKSSVSDVANQPRDESMTRRRLMVAEKPAPSAKSAKEGFPGGASTLSSTLTPNPAGYSFRVTGTNVSLKQKVVFDGSLAGSMISPQTNAVTFGAIGGALATNSSAALQLPGLHITGRATIGTNRLDISAKAADAP